MKMLGAELVPIAGTSPTHRKCASVETDRRVRTVRVSMPARKVAQRWTDCAGLDGRPCGVPEAVQGDVKALRAYVERRMAAACPSQPMVCSGSDSPARALPTARICINARA